MGSGEAAAFEEAEKLDGGFFVLGLEEELAKDVAAGVGEGIELGAGGFGGRRGHGPEDFAEGSAVVMGDPLGELEEPRVEDGHFVEELFDPFDGVGRGEVVGEEDDPGELAAAEGDDDASAGEGAMAQGLWKLVGEELVDRDRET